MVTPLLYHRSLPAWREVPLRFGTLSDDCLPKTGLSVTPLSLRDFGRGGERLYFQFRPKKSIICGRGDVGRLLRHTEKAPVFIIGEAGRLVVYLRNLCLRQKESSRRKVQNLDDPK